MGYRMNVLDIQVVKLGEVDIGVVDSTLGNANGTLRLRQYFIPGEKKSAVMTYGCRPDLFDHYRPIFEASANATRGAHSSRAIDWPRAMRGVLIGAGFCAIVAILVGLILFSQKSSTAPVVFAAPGPSVWECPSCRRHVPNRIPECRCGTPRPA